ncbi:fimbrial-like protein [Enterobacter genomosp. O]|uniref:fimbrial-like protein n=1 Tax=Enterobacter genomosp. O TaxID=2364150 RepID=UPI000AD81ADC
MFIQTGSLYRMFQSRLLVKNAMSWLALCLGFPTAGLASNLEMDMTANIINNTCQVSIPESGNVTLPTVGKPWFYTADGSDRLKPADPAGGTRFAVQVVNCSGDQSGFGQALHFSFKPQTAQTDGISKQIFNNETPALAGGAENVGIVIFSESNNQNVLDSNGQSDVVMGIATPSDQQSYLKDYSFYARYQNYGPVSAGKVTARVVVSVTYN